MRALIPLLVAGFALLAWMSSQAAPNAPVLEFNGQCDASAAVALDDDRFLVADDEDNVLRVYRISAPGLPITEYDLSDFLRIEKKNGEADIEGACRVGQRLYFISSHGRNKKGKDSPDRKRFFAVDFKLTGDDVEFKPAGDPYQFLLSDMAVAPQLRRFQLAEASKDAPKQEGALNIEGLCTMPDGTLMIGFRNPIPDGKTLMVPLKNADAVIAGRDAQFGDPILLDLGGLGVRSLGWWRDRLLIVAGHYDSGGVSKLFTWKPGEEPKHISGVRLKGLNPEGLTFDKSDSFSFVSDDGTEQRAGKLCKDLKDPIDKEFRMYRIPAEQLGF